MQLSLTPTARASIAAIMLIGGLAASAHASVTARAHASVEWSSLSMTVNGQPYAAVPGSNTAYAGAQFGGLPPVRNDSNGGPGTSGAAEASVGSSLARASFSPATLDSLTRVFLPSDSMTEATADSGTDRVFSMDLQLNVGDTVSVTFTPNLQLNLAATETGEFAYGIAAVSWLIGYDGGQPHVYNDPLVFQLLGPDTHDESCTTPVTYQHTVGRAGRWEVKLSADTRVVATPSPASLAPLACGLLLARGRRKE